VGTATLTATHVATHAATHNCNTLLQDCLCNVGTASTEVRAYTIAGFRLLFVFL